MNYQKLTTFFMWCTIINGGLLFLTIILGLVGMDWVYGLHGKLFQIPHETFNAVYYLFLGLYKIFWLVFNAVPYVALLIIKTK